MPAATSDVIDKTTIKYPKGAEGAAKAVSAAVPGARLSQSNDVSTVTLLLGNNGIQVKSLMPAKSSTAKQLGQSSASSSAPAGTVERAPTPAASTSSARLAAGMPASSSRARSKNRCSTSTSYLVATTWLTEEKSRVPPRVTRGEPELAPDQPEQRADDRRGDQEAELIALAEDGERDPDEQPHPEPGHRAGGGHLAPGEPAGDPLDGLELGADDGHLLHFEVVVGQVVHHLLRLRVAVVYPE